MRTNIDIDDALMDAALRAGPFSTKKDAVEAGLKLLARQAHYREILQWEGRLRWDDDSHDDAPPEPGAAAPAAAAAASAAAAAAAASSTGLAVHEPAAPYAAPARRRR